MSTLTSPRVRNKPERTVKVAQPPSDDNPFFVITFTERTKRTTKVTCYTVARIPTDFGDGYRVRRYGAAPGEVAAEYQVCLSDEGSYCCCLGFLSHGHCKHVSALTALAARGELS